MDYKTIYTSDSNEFLTKFGEYEFDIIFADPPYALGSEVIIRKDGKVDYAKASDFMNKWEMPTGEYWEKWFINAYRTLKHGGWLIMYGMDRQTLLFKYYALLAGFDEQQSLYWYFISNFPKATDLSKMIDKRGGGKFDTNQIAKAIKEARLNRKLTVSYCDERFCDGSTNWTWFEGRKDGVRPPTYETFMKIANEWQELLPLAELVKEAERDIVGELKTNTTLYKEIGNGSESGNIDITAPKTELAKKYDGYKYSVAPLKQTCETIMVFKKPTKTGSVLHDTLAFENGDTTITVSALDIDGNRVGTETRTQFSGKGSNSNVYMEYKQDNAHWEQVSGRYPAQTFVDEGIAQALDLQSGLTTQVDRVYKSGGENTSWFVDGIDKEVKGDTAGCSKILHKVQYEDYEHDIFIYQPKVNEGERNNGLNGFDEKQYSHDGRTKPIENAYQRNNSVAKNNHPTLKPIDLNAKVLKLFKTPNDQKICFPFAGSGSEILGGLQAGFSQWIACEINQDYVDIANARIKHYTQNEYVQLELF